MATATRSRRKVTQQFRESAPSVQAERIDKEKCVLYGVRVLGLESDNGRVYLREAVAAAVGKGLYEKTSVRMNHPDPESKADKPVEDINGWLFGVHVTEDGARGNWQLNPEHPMTPRILWAAENNPSQYGLSHNVGAVGEPRDGKFVITEIVSVTSVDLVSDPATVRGLFESRSDSMSEPVMKKIKRRVLLEGLRNKITKWRPKAPKLARRLCEAMDDAMGDTETQTDEADEPSAMKPEDHLKKGVYEACHSVIESDEMGADEKVKSIGKMLKMHEKMSATEADDKVDDAEVDTADEPEPETKDKKESRLELIQLRAEKAVRKLCESLSFHPTETMLAALTALPDDTKRKALISETIKSSGSGRPRSSSTTESRQGDNGGSNFVDTSKITTSEGFIGALKGNI